MSVRRLLRPFYRTVHPDLLHGYTIEVVTVNDKSLKELNAYVDRIECPEVVASPFVGRKLQFFMPMLNKKKEPLPGLTRPISLDLPTVGPSADMVEKEEAAVMLVHNVEVCMNVEDVRFSWKSSPAVSEVEPIIRSSSKLARGTLDVRKSLDRIWKQEVQDAASRNAIYNISDQSDPKFFEYKSIRLHNKLLAKYSKLKNARKRADRISNIPSQVSSLMSGLLPKTNSVTNCHDSTVSRKLRVIESGFHPDLVFVSPDLSEQDREEGIARVCGMNLELDSDIWLLENLWKAVRSSQYPPVPVVISKEYSAVVAGGYLCIPYDFVLEPDLVSFLEENLDLVRSVRKQLLDAFVAV